MFKKFNPKEDVASSTSLKSSVQRHIRNALLEQYPYLATPLNPSAEAEAPAAAAAGEAEAELEGPAEGKEQDDDDEPRKKGGKKGGKGGGKKDKGGKGAKGDKARSGGAGDADDADKEDGPDADAVLLDELWPRKEALGITKCRDHITIYTVHSVPLVMQHFDGPFIPTLHVLHRYPAILPHVRIDRGAIKFLLAGANMMAPGLLSAGGALPPGLPAGAIVAIDAEGKAHAAGVGRLTASSDEIRKAGKGVAVEVVCHLGDNLWKVDTL